MAKKKSYRNEFEQKKLQDLGQNLQYRDWTLVLLTDAIEEINRRLSDGNIAVLDAPDVTNRSTPQPAMQTDESADEDEYAAFFDG